MRSAYELQSIVRESCYPGYEPSTHGAIQWLQPGSRVVQEVVPRGRGRPDARAHVRQDVPPVKARAQYVRRPGVAEERCAVLEGSLRRAGRVERVKPLARRGRAAANPVAVNRVVGRVAAAVGVAEHGAR